MAIQHHIENRPTLVRFLSRVTWVETVVCSSPQSIFWDVDAVNAFKDSLAGKSSGQKVPRLVDLIPRKLGAWKGKVWMSPDFDDNQEIIELFEGSELFPNGDD